MKTLFTLLTLCTITTQAAPLIQHLSQNDQIQIKKNLNDFYYHSLKPVQGSKAIRLQALLKLEKALLGEVSVKQNAPTLQAISYGTHQNLSEASSLVRSAITIEKGSVANSKQKELLALSKKMNRLYVEKLAR